MKLSGGIRGSLVAVFALAIGARVEAGFPSTETFLPAVGRVAGQGGAQFYTTVWATNLTPARQTFTFQFLKVGQANTSPASFDDSLQPGETKMYENVVETKLKTTGLGAARVISSGEIFVAERIYNQAPGDDLGKTEGLFFAGVPKSFSISLGQSASIQGIDQGGNENFRYNFALVETGGGSPTVNVQIFDGSGTLLGQKAFILQPYEQIQPGVGDVVSGIATTNARITATVTGGTGSVLIAGAQVANESQDSSGFEMSFRDTLLGTQGGPAGVASLNGLTGALDLKPGSGISITPSGSSISIAYTGGGSSGITSVAHDASLTGAGTGASPLAIAGGQVVRSLNGLHDAVTLAAGANVTITPSGSTLTIASSGGGGGLALPFTGSVAASTAFQVTNTESSADAIAGIAETPSAISFQPAGIVGSSASHDGVLGLSDGFIGVFGESTNGEGVQGNTNAGSQDAVIGWNLASSGGGAGVEGRGEGSVAGVLGDSNSGFGVVARSGGTGLNGAALRAESTGLGIAMYVTNNSTDTTLVLGNANGSGDFIKGFGGGAVSPQFEVKATGAVTALSFNGNSNDFADRLPSEAGLAPGEVVAIGADGTLVRTTTANETDVAGVFSTQP
ncbi:MAG TPA: hypothetical protein VFL12_09640, partial [Thermoanaerobaculia bacterium]|nr:hypothetical protein [Thermoanaerobaculia bacterium]